MMQEAKFDVVYSEEAKSFLHRIDEKTRIKILENIDKATKLIDPKLFKKLNSDIWEFRTLYNNKKYRILAFWDKENKKKTLVIATHGFIKKTSKVPQKEIDKANQIMKIYFEEKH
ncbi:MAG: type II toxin-antitoxin system RelE/ParE family toxin [Bacteroidales bacterium]|nr:type II toxin-antitoxin system RelE/ParE family toxin [Bacteroidales bacterium]